MRPLIYGHPSCEGLLQWDLRLTTHSVSPPLLADALRPLETLGPFDGTAEVPPNPPPLPPPGVPSSYLLNLLCPQWYGFRKPLSFGLHSGFFNYVVHFTCLCSFTPQDQGHERFNYFKTRSLNRTLQIHNIMIPCLLLHRPYFEKAVIGRLRKETENIVPLL